MDSSNYGLWIPVIVAIVAAVGSIYAAYMAHNSPSNQASAIMALSNTVKGLTADLEEERIARKTDKAMFERELESLRSSYELKIAQLEVRIIEAEREKDQLIIENHKLKNESSRS